MGVLCVPSVSGQAHHCPDVVGHDEGENEAEGSSYPACQSRHRRESRHQHGRQKECTRELQQARSDGALPEYRREEWVCLGGAKMQADECQHQIGDVERDEQRDEPEERAISARCLDASVEAQAIGRAALTALSVRLDVSVVVMVFRVHGVSSSR